MQPSPGSNSQKPARIIEMMTVSENGSFESFEDERNSVNFSIHWGENGVEGSLRELAKFSGEKGVNKSMLSSGATYEASLNAKREARHSSRRAGVYGGKRR
jgi:hypothetical protein